jgi:hypothetical protein
MQNMKSEITNTSFLLAQSISTEIMQSSDCLLLNEESGDVAWADSRRRQRIWTIPRKIHSNTPGAIKTCVIPTVSVRKVTSLLHGSWNSALCCSQLNLASLPLPLQCEPSELLENKHLCANKFRTSNFANTVWFSINYSKAWGVSVRILVGSATVLT